MGCNGENGMPPIGGLWSETRRPLIDVVHYVRPEDPVLRRTRRVVDSSPGNIKTSRVMCVGCANPSAVIVEGVGSRRHRCRMPDDASTMLPFQESGREGVRSAKPR